MNNFLTNSIVSDFETFFMAYYNGYLGESVLESKFNAPHAGRRKRDMDELQIAFEIETDYETDIIDYLRVIKDTNADYGTDKWSAMRETVWQNKEHRTKRHLRLSKNERRDIA